MKYLSTLFAIAFLSLQAFGQTQTTLHNVVAHHAATFTSASGTAYTAGDSVGTAQTLTNIVGASSAGRIITLDGFTLKDSANQKKAGYLLFFEGGTAPSLTDNAAFAWGSTIGNFIARVDIAASDYVTLDSKAVVTVSFLGVRMKMSATSPNIQVFFVTNDTPTYGNGGTLTFDFHFSN